MQPEAPDHMSNINYELIQAMKEKYLELGGGGKPHKSTVIINTTSNPRRQKFSKSCTREIRTSTQNK